MKAGRKTPEDSAINRLVTHNGGFINHFPTKANQVHLLACLNKKIDPVR